MPNDLCTTEGAALIKSKIESYWAERGYEVKITLINAGFVPSMRSARIDIRSNIVNGVPPKSNRAKTANRHFKPTFNNTESYVRTHHDNLELCP